MSLINHVLRDLDRREVSTATLAAPVRAAAAAAAQTMPHNGRVMLALAGLGTVAVLWFHAAPPVVAVGSAPWAAESSLRETASLPAPRETPAVAVSAVVVPPELPASATAGPVIVPPALAASGLAPMPVLAPGGAVPGFEPPRAASAVAPVAAMPVTTAARPAPAPVVVALVAADAPPTQAAPDVPQTDPDAAALPLLGGVRIDKRTRASQPQERADAAYRAGLSAHERGDYTDAARSYAAALQDAAHLVPARVGLAGVLIAQSRLPEAEALLQAGLALDAQQPLLVQPMARLLADRGELPAAIGLMQSALPGGAASAEFRACLAALLQRAGQQREAAGHFDAALRLQPANGVWWMGLALALAAQGQSEAARTAYTRARQTGSLSPELAHFVDQQLHAPL